MRSIPAMFGMSKVDFIPWAWLMLKTWCANQRSVQHYARLNAAAAWKGVLSDRCYRTWKACMGPWVGSDWTVCSLHTAGQFFRKQLTSHPSHPHRADAEGPAWKHGAGDGWLLLRGPSSEYWFDRWVRHLSNTGVEFSWSDALHRLHFDGSTVTGADLESGRSVQADLYVVAVDPFAAASIFARTPSLEAQAEICRFRPLVQDGPHSQVSFRLAFPETVRFPRKRTAVLLADTEFNLTLFAQDQVWRQDVDLGEGVKSLWTGTACVGTNPGRIHGLPVIRCTKEQFIEEVLAQIMACQSLDALIREANDGRGLRDFPPLRVEVWHEWTFDQEGIRPVRPKWVTTTNTQPHQPDQATGVPNLFLAGAHTRTEVDVWSIEGAVESGRRAARGIDPRVPVLGQYKHPGLRLLSRLDDMLFKVGAPSILDVLLAAGALFLVLLALSK